MLRLLLLCALSTSANLALAGGNSNYETLKELYVADGKYYMVGQTYSNPDGCTTTYNRYVLSDELVSTEEMRGAMYSMALTAYTARLKIRFYLHGCNTNGYPLIRFTELEPDST